MEASGRTGHSYPAGVSPAHLRLGAGEETHTETASGSEASCNGLGKGEGEGECGSIGGPCQQNLV